ncbi:MAG: DegT/DnrJ/EryC1/StrS family aminotransferase [Deltaproteobacteria bacterium]|nr:DegT/DnrJ/EryC1/StrS family aminotransferase [Deltaproteobacteria bacterium]
MRIPLLDLQAQYRTIAPEVDAAVQRVVTSQRFILGPEVEGFEASVAEYLGVGHAVGVSNGSDALYLTLAALGVGPGSEVITTAYSFVATVEAIVRVGARPILVDIDPETYLLDVHKALEEVGPRTAALLPVHLFGRCVDIPRLRAAAPSIPIVEDAAQAFGASHAGIHAGALGAAGCFSFFPAKNLGGFGDGGMVTTHDASLARALRSLRAHGQRRGTTYMHERMGGNCRLDALQAAVLSVKLPYLPGWNAGRRRNAERYQAAFESLDLPIALPPRSTPKSEDVFGQFVIRAPRRDALRTHLAEAGIGSAIYYPHGLHREPCFFNLGYTAGDFPHAEKAARECLALPIYPELSPTHIDEVVQTIASFYQG